MYDSHVQMKGRLQTKQGKPEEEIKEAETCFLI